MLSFGKGLMLYKTIPTFHDLGEDSFGKQLHFGEKEKMLVTSIFSFFTMFSTLSKREIIILATFNITSANVFNSITYKALLFGIYTFQGNPHVRFLFNSLPHNPDF